jgi:ABC-type sugar transport system substrate-binding protein
MTRFAALLLAALAATPVAAQEAEAAQSEAEAEQSIIRDGTGVTLDEFLWTARPVIVFADSPADPRFVQQMEAIRARESALAERDVVVLTDTDPAARSDLRRELRPRGFMLAIIGKDGTLIVRKPLPWDVREITRSIDKQPLRQQEIREQSQSG